MVGEGEAEVRLGEDFPTLDIEALQSALRAEGRFATEIAVLVCQNITRIKELEAMIDSYSMMVERNTLTIRREKEQVEKLPLNMMPRAAHVEYKTFGVVSPRRFKPVSVLALDFAGSDDLLAVHEAGVVVSELNDIYSAFDRIGEQFVTDAETAAMLGDGFATESAEGAVRLGDAARAVASGRG